MDPQDFAAIRKTDPQIYPRHSEENLPLSERWTGFQIGWFLLDLIIALGVAWGFAMLIDRVLFPLMRSKRRRSGEAS